MPDFENQSNIKPEVTISGSLDSQEKLDNYSRLARLQFVTCQLETIV